MVQIYPLIQDLQSALIFCKNECKHLGVSTRADIIETVQQSPDYLKWVYNHGIRHSQMQIADVIIKAFTLFVNDFDNNPVSDFSDVLEELIKDTDNRSAVLSAQGFQRLNFVHALRNAMALPLSNPHELDELKETADSLLSVVSKLSEELVQILNMLKAMNIEVILDE